MADLETWLAEEASIIQKNENEKQVYMFDWLGRLVEHLLSGNADTNEIKKCQPKIVATLQKLLNINCSPATRQQLAKCFATIYTVGTTFGMHDSVGKWLDIIRSKDDSTVYLAIKLTAICCFGAVFEKLGRMVGTLYDEGYLILCKLLPKAEPQAKCEILLCLEKLLIGMGNSGANGFKDIYKACKVSLLDKAMPVRWAAAKCALELSRHASFMYTNEIESFINICFKSLEGSNYDVRIQVAELIGQLMASSQNSAHDSKEKLKKISIEEMLSLMSNGFLRGGSGFGTDLLKGSMGREVRVGITQAYVVLFREMGTKWITKYLAPVMIHILELVASPKAVPSHIDAVYSRKCIAFILNKILSGFLAEASQVQAVKELCKIITKQMNNIHSIVTSDQSAETVNNEDVIMTQHVLVCALEELSNLVLALTSSLRHLMLGTIVEAIFSTLIHPAPAVWLSAAWSIRCCAIAIPSFLTELIDTCIEKMTKLRSSPEAVTGYGYTLAAVIGGLNKCPLGIPYKKIKVLFTLTDELLQSVGQSGKLALCKIQTGWVLMGALCTTGPSIMKNFVPRMIQIWSSSFPSNMKELDGEKARGNMTTWQLTLENRAGALCSMTSFLRHCKDLLYPDLVKKLLVPIDTALSALPMIPTIIKGHGALLKPCAAMFKMRLYTLLSILQPKFFEGSFTPLLRELVAEFTLADHRGSVTTSLLQSFCHQDDSILLGSWLQETDHKDVEEQLLTNSASGSGALEHDSSCVYSQCSEHEVIPGPLPLGVAVIDSSIKLFGHVFPNVAQKHRSQLMAHFTECISKTKGLRQQAIQTNIFTAFLSALKNLAEAKNALGDSTVRDAAHTLVQDALTNPDNILRCAAGEALGRMAQVVDDPNFVAQTVQKSFELCQKSSDAIIRTGHSLALGCLHRYVGSMGTGQHLSNSVSVLIALANDSSSTAVQVWSLHGLTLIADSGGPMFRGFVDKSLSTAINLMLTTPPSMTEVHQCLGKCVGALITAIGPELQDTSKAMERSRMFCMSANTIMTNHPDSQVQSESINCLQQLHIFAPNVVNLNTLVPHLCNLLLSPHLLLRRGSVGCLRQLAHREAEDICKQGMKVIEENEEIKKRMFIAGKGIEGLLFSLLDAEVEPGLQKHIRETLVSLLQTLAVDNVGHWLGLCKQVLLATKAEDIIKEDAAEKDKDQKDDDEDDEEGGQIVATKVDDKPNMTPKWPTRVFAMECTRMILDVCKNEEKHMNLSVARSLMADSQKKSVFLVMQLAELVRMAFIAGTSTNELLKLEGMNALQDVVVLFARVPDPDVKGQVILEQFQAQVGTALRPAFESRVPPDITAMACEVCSSWIGSGISRDIEDVQRIQQLLVHSLNRINSDEWLLGQIYSESAYTLETLAVLKAWAQIYIMAVKHKNFSAQPADEEFPNSTGRLLDLVEGDLALLARHWICALRDYVLLMLPSHYASQLPPDGGTFYSATTIDNVRAHYKKSWPPMALAVALWLNECGFVDDEKVVVGASDETPTYSSLDTPSRKSNFNIRKDRFHLICGVSIEALSSPLMTYPDGTIESCIQSVNTLLDSHFGRSCITREKTLSIELLTVLHRLLLTNDDASAQSNILSIVMKCSVALQERISTSDRSASTDSTESDSLDSEDKDEREDEVSAKKSIVFSLLEICSFMVSKHASEMMPDEFPRPAVTSKKQEFGASSIKILCHVSQILATLPELCSPKASVKVLPTVLFLMTSCLKVICINVKELDAQLIPSLKEGLAKLVLSLKMVLTCSHAADEEVKSKWATLIQSALFEVIQISSVSGTFSDQDQGSSPVIVVWENLLLALSVFLVYSAPLVSTNARLIQSTTDVYSNCLADGPHKLQLQVIKILENMMNCSEKNISYPFIHNCVPRVVAILENSQTTKINSDIELNLCKESITLLEKILSMVEEMNRVMIMNIYIGALVEHLYNETTLVKANSFTRALHDFCIQRLTVTGPIYPAAFKSVMGESMNMKKKLEAAIKANRNLELARKGANASRKSSEQAQPQIALKMDFSNFK